MVRRWQGSSGTCWPPKANIHFNILASYTHYSYLFSRLATRTHRKTAKLVVQIVAPMKKVLEQPIIQGQIQIDFTSTAALRRSQLTFSLSPMYLSSNCGPRTHTNPFLPKSLPAACAIAVFPQPGGPYSSIALGRRTGTRR